MRRLQGPCKTVLPSFRAGTEDLSPEFRIFVSDTRIPIRYATHCVDSRRGVLSGRMRLPSGADGRCRDGGRGPAARLPAARASGAAHARRTARLPPSALLGRLRLRRHALPRPGRYVRHVRDLRAVRHGAVGPSGGPCADGLAHAPRRRVAPDARLLLDAGRRGAARSQFAAAQRRVLHSRPSGATGRALVRRVRAHRAGVRPEDGDAEPCRAACQRFPLYARFGSRRNAVRAGGRVRAALRQ